MYVTTERCAPECASLDLWARACASGLKSGHGETRRPPTARWARSNVAIQLCHHASNSSTILLLFAVVDSILNLGSFLSESFFSKYSTFFSRNFQSSIL